MFDRIVYELPDRRFAVHLANRVLPVETRSLRMTMALLAGAAVRRAIRDGVDDSTPLSDFGASAS
ncbi:hypothetical protein [Bradyrhizobium guangdongense]